MACITLPLMTMNCSAGSNTDYNSFGRLLFSFQVMSDTEVIASPADADCNIQFDKALSQIENNDPDSSAIFIAGDVLNRGTIPNWKKWREIIENHKGLPKIYSALGNHDLTDNGTYDELFGNYMEYSGMSGTYYDEWINDTHFIVIGQEDSGHNKPEYSDEQFRWLEEKLSERASYDKPIFLFSHYSIRNTSAGTYLSDQIGHAVGSTDKQRFIELLSKYPQVIYFTGHTHFAVDDEHAHYNIDTKNGRGADILCDAAITYLAAGTYEAIPGSQFFFTEVYEHAVVVKGWDVINNRWVPGAEYIIDTSKKTPTEMTVPKIELSHDSVSADNKDEITVYITYEDTARIEASSGAWVGIVSSGNEGIVGDTYRYAMLQNLKKDEYGRFIWNIADDSICGTGSKTWVQILRRKGSLNIGLFEDTLYLGSQPTVPSYNEYRYDPYARTAKAELKIESDNIIALSGNGTYDDPITVNNAEQFVYLIDSIMSGESFSGKYIKQTTDIDLSESIYYIIDSDNTVFDGIYDGAGHVISGLRLTGESGGYSEFNGVFGAVSGTVMNVGVVDTHIEGKYASGLVRKLVDGGCLINSYSFSQVDGDERGTGLCDYFTGKSPMISNCYFAGKASGNAVVGSNFNVNAPILSEVYYESGSSKGSSPTAGATEYAHDRIYSDDFVAALNRNRKSVSELSGIPIEMLWEWEIGGEGYPVFKSEEHTAEAVDNIETETTTDITPTEPSPNTENAEKNTDEENCESFSLSRMIIVLSSLCLAIAAAVIFGIRRKKKAQ